MFVVMSDPADEQRAWLRAVLAETGLSMNALAKKAGVSSPTISAFLQEDKANHNLSARTVARIEKATGMRYGPAPRPTASRDREAVQLDRRQPAQLLELIRDISTVANGFTEWTLQSRALEHAGYMPGDLLIVDINTEPKPGDVVCAQIYDWARSKSDTIFRLWEPPYLAPATSDPRLRKIFIVDNETTVIRGTVVASARGRLAKAA